MKPSKSPINNYTVRTLTRRLRTPAQVQAWLKSLAYNPAETMRTLPEVIKHKKAHCLEGAMAAAAILEQRKFPPLILDIQSADLLDHTLFLYRRRGKYGTVGKSRDIGLDGRKPVFRTIRDLVNSYAIPYIDEGAEIIGYGVLDLRKLNNGRWRSSRQNVWYVEEALRRIPHHKFRLARKTVNYWRQRFIEFKKLHPAKQPPFFPGQSAWL